MLMLAFEVAGADCARFRFTAEQVLDSAGKDVRPIVAAGVVLAPDLPPARGGAAHR